MYLATLKNLSLNLPFSLPCLAMVLLGSVPEFMVIKDCHKNRTLMRVTAINESFYGFLSQSKLPNRAFDVGCGLGRTTFELAREFEECIGLEKSQSFVNACNELKQNGEMTYHVCEEGDVHSTYKAKIDPEIVSIMPYFCSIFIHHYIVQFQRQSKGEGLEGLEVPIPILLKFYSPCKCAARSRRSGFSFAGILGQGHYFLNPPFGNPCVCPVNTPPLPGLASAAFKRMFQKSPEMGPQKVSNC